MDILDKMISTTCNRKPQFIQTWEVMKIFFSHNKDGHVGSKVNYFPGFLWSSRSRVFLSFWFVMFCMLALCPHFDSPHRWPQQFWVSYLDIMTCGKRKGLSSWVFLGQKHLSQSSQYRLPSSVIGELRHKPIPEPTLAREGELSLLT